MNYKKEYIYPLENIAKNKEYFEEMARKGWILKSLSSYKATYVEAEPTNWKFFIIPKSGLKKKRINEIIEHLREFGWKKLVDNVSSYVYVIDEASEGSDFILTEEDELNIYKKIHTNSIFNTISPFIALSMPLLFRLIFRDHNYNLFYDFFYRLNTDFTLTFVQLCIYSILLVLIIVSVVRRIMIKYKFEVRETEKKYTITSTLRFFASIIVPVMLLIITLVSINNESGALIPNGPYLTLADFGINYKNIPVDKEKIGRDPYSNGLRIENTLISKYTNAYEWYDNYPLHDVYNVRTEIFEMKNEKYRNFMLDTLKYISKDKGYKIADGEIEGLENVFYDPFYLIFSKNNTVWKLRYNNSDLPESNENEVYKAIKDNVIDINEIIDR